MTAILSFVTLHLDAADYDICDEEHEASHPGFVKQLAAPVEFVDSLPDPSSGVPQPQRISLSISNTLIYTGEPTVSYLFTLGDLYGRAVDGEQYDPDTGATIRTFRGTIVDVTEINDVVARVVVETLDSDRFSTPSPPISILQVFPSTDLTTMRDQSAPVRVPFGVMRKVDMAQCIPTVVSVIATVAAGAGDKYIYCKDTSIPALYRVNAGDRLVYDVYQIGDTRTAMGLYDGTTLLWSTTAADQNGHNNYAGTDLSAFSNKWYRRDIPLPTAMVGQVLTTYLIGCEQDTAGTYVTYFANAAILDRYGNVKVSMIGESLAPTYDTASPFLKSPAGSSVVIAQALIWDIGAVRYPALSSYGNTLSAGSITVPNPDQYNAKSFSVHAVFSGAAPGALAAIGGRVYSSGDGWAIGVTTGGKFRVQVSTGGGSVTSANSNGTITGGAYHFLDATYDDSAKLITIYIDGIFDKSFSYAGTITTGGGSFTFGAAVFTLAALAGTLSELAYYSRVLPAGEVAFHTSAKKTGYEPNLDGYWPMEEGSGSTITDYSPYANSATVAGNTWVTGPVTIYNVINSLYSAGAVVPRELWQPVTWGAFLLARLFDAPRTADGRLPALQMDLVSREFQHNPALVGNFLITNTTYGAGLTVDADVLSLAAAQFSSLVNPAGYRIDGGLASQVTIQETLRQVLLHGSRVYRLSSGSYGIDVDTANYAGAFNGTTGYLDLTDRFDRANVLPYTIELQLYLRSSTFSQVIFSKSLTDGSGLQGYDALVDASGKFQFRRMRDGTINSVTSLVAIPLNEWHHWAIVYDGANLTLYMDGVLQQTIASSLNQKNTTIGLTIGAVGGGGANWTNALIDEFRGWNIARSLSDIQANQDLELTSLPSSLVVYVTFNQPTEGAVFDLGNSTWYPLVSGFTISTEAQANWNNAPMGLGDGDYASTAWMNCQLQSESLTPLSDRLSVLTLQGRQDPGFDGSPTWNISSQRSLLGSVPLDRGKTDSEQNPYIDDWFTLDHEVYYLLWSRYAGRSSVEVVAHRQAYGLSLGQIVTLVAPNRPVLNNTRKRIEQIVQASEDLQFTLRSWSSTPYEWARGTSQAPPVFGSGGLTDYSQTRPDAPTSLAVSHSAYNTAGDHTVTVRVQISANAPSTANVTALVFERFFSGGSEPVETLTIPCQPGDSGVLGYFDLLATATPYDYDVYGFAGGNKAGFQEGFHTSIVSSTTLNVPGAPSAPSSVTVLQNGKTIVVSVGGSPPGATSGGWGSTRFYINTTNNSGTATKFADNKAMSAPYQNVTYGQGYYVWASFVNNNGQESTLTGASGTPNITVNRLSGDGSSGTPTGDLNNADATLIKSGRLTVASSNGASEILITGSGAKLRLQTIDASPTEITFETTGGSVKARISGADSPSFQLWVVPESNNGADFSLGRTGRAWSTIDVETVDDILINSSNAGYFNANTVSVGAPFAEMGSGTSHVTVKKNGSVTLTGVVVSLFPGSGDIQWGKPLVSLGGGAAATLGTIGGSGPATAAQFKWMRVIDDGGIASWIPVWR